MKNHMSFRFLPWNHCMKILRISTQRRLSSTFGFSSIRFVLHLLYWWSFDGNIRLFVILWLLAIIEMNILTESDLKTVIFITLPLHILPVIWVNLLIFIFMNDRDALFAFFFFFFTYLWYLIFTLLSIYAVVWLDL